MTSYTTEIATLQVTEVTLKANCHSAFATQYDALLTYYGNQTTANGLDYLTKHTAFKSTLTSLASNQRSIHYYENAILNSS